MVKSNKDAEDNYDEDMKKKNVIEMVKGNDEEDIGQTQQN